MGRAQPAKRRGESTPVAFSHLSLGPKSPNHHRPRVGDRVPEYASTLDVPIAEPDAFDDRGGDQVALKIGGGGDRRLLPILKSRAGSLPSETCYLRERLTTGWQI